MAAARSFKFVAGKHNVAGRLTSINYSQKIANKL